MSINQSQHLARHIAHWDNIALNHNKLNPFNSAYHLRLQEVYKLKIGKGLRVLEIGCGEGDLLASLDPTYGVGIDISVEMIKKAQAKFHSLEFKVMDAHDLKLNGKFDLIILSDLINDVWDVQSILNQLKSLCTDETRLILNFYSRVYQPIVNVAGGFGLARKLLPQNWFTPTDVENLIHISGFEVINEEREILLPLNIPLISSFFNKFLVKMWPFSFFAWTNVLTGRLLQNPPTKKPSVSIIIPARNEAGNIENAFLRLPKFGSSQELIFVEGNSTDDTYHVIQEAIAAHPEIKSALYKQPGKGKADAVRVGFEKATGEILMILDADLTVQPEDLVRFYDVIHSGKGEFVNGVRLVYPMGDQAMRFLNLLGNKFFSAAFTWLLGQPIKDTLCGTKVLTKKNYDRIVDNRAYFGDFDPFGDYDLIFGAAKLNLKIVDLPIRYQDRTYGSTNIDRWRHGALLFKMLFVAAKRLKFT